MADKRPEYFAGLEAVGFKVSAHGNVFRHVFEKQGRHYIDMGVSQKIIDGKIKMKSDALIESWGEKGLIFDNGSELEADVVVITTGFERDLRRLVGEWFGPQVKGRVSERLGQTVDEEGEVEGLARPMGQPNLWHSGISIGLMRWTARFIAVQIKADLAGTPLPVYDRKLPIALKPNSNPENDSGRSVDEL